MVQYGTTTTFTGLLESDLQYGIIPIMILIVCGSAFIKSVISGTVPKETTPETRAKGFSIFYAMVNIGAFSGKTIVKPLREALGNEGLITLNYFSASMTFLVLLAIWFFYKSSQHSGEGKTFSQIWQALIKVCCNGRLISGRKRPCSLHLALFRCNRLGFGSRPDYLRASCEEAK